jgi:hypothetical protein
MSAPRRWRSLGVGVTLAAALPGAASAQEMRTLESSRQLRDSAATIVRLRYAAGELNVRPAREAQLYRMELRYDPAQVEPIHRYDAAARRLELGVRAEHVELGRRNRHGRMDLELARGVPLDLTLELGAARADLDLGGLSLDALRLHAGASESVVRFGTPNPRPMRRLEIHAGAASFRALDLANANAPLVSVEAGVGGVELDFGDAWTQDVDLDVRVALGGTTVRLPRRIGVWVELDRAFAGFDHVELERRGRAWVSPNWDEARHRLRIRGSAAFGTLTIDRR